jgi:hypothetical protein
MTAPVAIIKERRVSKSEEESVKILGIAGSARCLIGKPK